MSRRTAARRRSVRYRPRPTARLRSLSSPTSTSLMMSGEGLVPRHRSGDPQRQLYRHAPRSAFSGCFTRITTARVAHECIVDPRALKTVSGVTVDDIAKRLIDYGFHAPTMSFPVPGTLMIEPTESESKAELDRFCDAMIAIRREDRRCRGRSLQNRGPRRCVTPRTRCTTLPRTTGPGPIRAPKAASGRHGAHRQVLEPRWDRVDNVHGDRNLICSCPPIFRLRAGGGVKHRR